MAARTNFSIGESILKVEDLVDSAKALGEKVVAITDTMSVTAMIDFTNRCKKAEIKPVIGCRLRLVDDPTWRKQKGVKEKNPPEYFLTYYVLSEKGLNALFRLLTLANSDSHFYFTAKLGFSDLYDALDTLTQDDVAIAFSDAQSVIHHVDAHDIARRLIDAVSAQNVFLTLVPVNTPYFDTCNKKAIAIAKDLGLQTLVARPALYPTDAADAQQIMSAISGNKRVGEVFAPAPHNRDFHPLNTRGLIMETKLAIDRLKARGVADAAQWFKAGLENVKALAERVEYQWKKAPVSLPAMAPDEFAAVVAECKKGWAKRFAAPVFAHRPSDEELADVYRPRLAYELSVLKKLAFSGYFLLVQDVVNYAKSNGILVGPGRGSVGGSLVAYLMGITDCDPLRFGLLFERFINPDRIDLPDADLDFMSARRHEVIDYLIGKYGQTRVAGVSNFGTLGPASSIRDVSRVLGLEEMEYRCSKLVPAKHGQSVELKDAADQVAEIAAFRDKYTDAWNVMLQLEGVMRNLAQHAAGVVVGGCDLVERAVIERRKEGSVVCWDKRIVEDQGLVKMDILGLSTLDLIDLTMKYIRRRHSKKVDLMRIPLDDPRVLENFANGLTTGVFQFESGGMRRLLKELGADGCITFDDITAATALYRPGPMESGMMDSYYLRKQGNETVEYDHPLMESILKPTFGVMVYQEQVMQVARTIAGYSAPDADKLRKIMGKKLPEEMAKERGKFVEGCVKTVGATEDWAGDLFDKIEGFAGYGFNKSHSVEYTLISYQSMWLKTYYGVEFFAAALSLMDEDKLPALLKDAERFGITIDLPDINHSTAQFEIITDTRLCIPFNRVKGVGEKSAEIITTIRGHTPFASMEDFEKRIKGNGRYCNKGHIDKLTRIGAFASIDPTQPAQRDPSRIRDQRELIPGLITDLVPVNRSMHVDAATRAKIVDLVRDYQQKHGPSGSEGDGANDGLPVRVAFPKKARFMVVSDAPSWQEEKNGQFSVGESFGAVAEALGEAGLSRNDGYFTGLIKRPKEGKQVSPKEIATYLPWLNREIELLKPPAIVLLGSQTVRQFFPEFKGKASDSAGKVIYSKELDANIVIGFSPGEIFHDSTKQLALNEVFRVVSEIIT
jgi:DNA polymerase-3 subunit alpha